jgi:PKD domain
MSSSDQTPIVFTVAVDEDDWDNLFGGWRCSALRIPGAQVDDVYAKRGRVDKSWYEVHKNAMIKWVRENPPEKALIVISLTEELSTQGRTDKWKQTSIRWKKVSITLTFISSILVVLIPAIFQYASRTPPTHPTGHAVFNLQPVYGDCGLVTVNGSVEMPDGSQEKITRVRWDWGDGATVDGCCPATHRYSQNGTYTAKVTAYVSDNETDEKNIVVNISNANQANCR